jgi:hypothetical protein
MAMGLFNLSNDSAEPAPAVEKVLAGSSTLSREELEIILREVTDHLWLSDCRERFESYPVSVGISIEGKQGKNSNASLSKEELETILRAVMNGGYN